MDLSIAIARINPAAMYRLSDAKDAILEWRGPGVQPTAQQLTDAWAAYQAEQTTAQQQRDADAAADSQDRAAVVQANPTTTLQSYIDTPNATITPGQTYTTVKLLCRVAIWLIRRELKRTI